MRYLGCGKGNGKESDEESSSDSDSPLSAGGSGADGSDGCDSGDAWGNKSNGGGGSDPALDAALRFRNGFPGHSSLRPHLARVRWEYHWRRLLRSIMFVGVEAVAFAAPVVAHVVLLLHAPVRGEFGVLEE